MPPSRDANIVLRPNFGVYFDRPSASIPLRGMEDCLNVRIRNGEISNNNIGWDEFLPRTLSGPVTLIDNFFRRDGTILTIFGTTKDLYKYDTVGDDVVFITPIYATGTITILGGSPTIVTGSGTTWLTNLKAGDEMSFGSATETDPDATWSVIASVDSDTQVTLTAAAAAQTGGTAYTGRKLFVGTVFNYWRTETFLKAQPDNEDKWYATNGVDFIVEWDGTDAQVTLLSALGITCNELFKFKNKLVYGNITLSGGEARPTSIRVSATTNPTNVTTDGAVELVTHDGPDEIVGFGQLGDNMIVYSDRTVTMVQFVGAPLVFILRTAVRGIGPLSGRAIADFGDFHEFLGADAQYRFDGVQLVEINNHVMREVLRTTDPGRVTLFNSHFDEEQGELLWFVPRTTDPNVTDGAPQKAFVQHYLEDVGRAPEPFTIRFVPALSIGNFERLDTLTFADLTDAWSDQNFQWNDQFFQAAFPFVLFGDENGKILRLNTAQKFVVNGVDTEIDSYAKFGVRPLGDGRKNGLVKRIYPMSTKLPAATYSLSVTSFVGDQLATDMVSTRVDSYDLTHAGNRFVSPFVSGRYAQVQFGTTGQGEAFTLQGYDVDVVPAGER